MRTAHLTCRAALVALLAVCATAGLHADCGECGWRRVRETPVPVVELPAGSSSETLQLTVEVSYAMGSFSHTYYLKRGTSFVYALPVGFGGDSSSGMRRISADALSASLASGSADSMEAKARALSLAGQQWISQAMQSVGVPQDTANGLDAGLSMSGTIGAGMALRAGGASLEMGVTTVDNSMSQKQVIGNTALSGVSDDMLVHFSQVKNINSIKAHGVLSHSGYSYFFRVGDVRYMTASGVKCCIGPLAQGGNDIGIAVIVSPEAAEFSKVGLEYMTFQKSVPWTLIRQVPGGCP